MAAVSGIMLTLLLTGMLSLTFDVQRVESLEPPETEWTRTYSGHGAFSVVQTSDGGYALAGYTWTLGAGHWDSWVVKVDSSGIVQWNRTYGGAGNDAARSVVETSDVGYALTGYTGSFEAGDYDFWLVKVACPSLVDGFGSLVLYIALASTITLAIVVTAFFVKHKKKQ